MIEIVPGGSSRPYCVRLGEPAEFDLVAADPTVEVRLFLQQQAVRCLKPLTDWAAPRHLIVRPESPGAYTLSVQWRDGSARRGWSKQPFEVTLGSLWRRFVLSPTPRRIKLSRGLRLWVPSAWEAAVFSTHERVARSQLFSMVPPGSTVYDVGANIGLYSVLLAHLVGPSGHVYAVEANPLVVYFLRINLEENDIRNCTILPTALLNEDASVPFTINYGNSQVGVTTCSAFHDTKIGNQVTVQGHALDGLIEALDLLPPDFVKMDIEGGEGPAVYGMRAALARHRPTILVEIHGHAAAQATLASLAGLGYRYRDVDSGATFADEAALLSWFPEAVRQIVCTRAG